MVRGTDKAKIWYLRGHSRVSTIISDCVMDVMATLQLNERIEICAEEGYFFKSSEKALNKNAKSNSVDPIFLGA